jgi:hypothetical protein
MHMKSRAFLPGVLLLLNLCVVFEAAGLGLDEKCWICGRPLGAKIVLWKDEAAGVKRSLCGACAALPDSCYVCSLPLRTIGVDLKDGRFLCERDAKSVILDPDVIAGVCQELSGALDKQFSRYLSFPANVSFHVADRLTLMDLFKVPGKDYTCPNVLGFTSLETNGQGQAEYSISILSGQSRAATEATCAHELTHAWMLANLPEERRKELYRDATEGFCELIAFMAMREKVETEQMAVLQQNLYTRGHLGLFVDAESRFKFGDVLDWIRLGEADRLAANDIWRIRKLKPIKPAKPAAAPTLAGEPPPAPALADRLLLKSISLGGKTPMALINQCTLSEGETGTVKLASTNLLIRCKAIRADSVLIEFVGMSQTQELRFEPKPGKGAGHQP